MRSGKTPDFQRLGDGCEDLLDLIGENRAEAALVETLEFLGGDSFADAMRGFGAEIGGDQCLLDVVERRGVERSAAGEAGEIVGNALGGLAKPAAQAVEPTHAQTAVSCLPSQLVMRA